MKKESVFILVALLLLCSAPAFAQVSYYKFWVTDNDSVAPSSSQTTFEWDQVPYAYIEFKNPDSAKAISSAQTTLTWTWQDTVPPIVNQAYPDGAFGSANAQWITYELTEVNPVVNWSNIRKEGTWTVSGTSTVLFADGARKIYTGSNTFNVNPVPEPLSCLLFLAGGIPFAVRRLRK